VTRWLLGELIFVLPASCGGLLDCLRLQELDEVISRLEAGERRGNAPRN